MSHGEVKFSLLLMAAASIASNDATPASSAAMKLSSKYQDKPHKIIKKPIALSIIIDCDPKPLSRKAPTKGWRVVLVLRTLKK